MFTPEELQLLKSTLALSSIELTRQLHEEELIDKTNYTLAAKPVDSDGPVVEYRGTRRELLELLDHLPVILEAVWLGPSSAWGSYSRLYFGSPRRER